MKCYLNCKTTTFSQEKAVLVFKMNLFHRDVVFVMGLSVLRGLDNPFWPSVTLPLDVETLIQQLPPCASAWD